MNKSNPTALVILDGLGYSPKKEYNGVLEANPKHFLSWYKKYPSALLKADGTHVGLLKNMIGNSEVGHLTIGSGRVIKQPASKLLELINSGEFFKNKTLIKNFKELKKNKKKLHLIGLLSDAGVHSHDKILYALLKLAKKIGIKDIVVHPILDGRDVAPKSAAKYLKRLEKLKIGKIGSIHGRFYAMDRDKHFDRTKLSYATLTKPQKIIFDTWQKALKYSYDHNVSDEFFVPIQISADSTIAQDDGLVFINFRADRARQLTTALLDKKLSWIITAVKYADNLNTDVIYKNGKIKNSFLDVLEKNKKTIFSIAETEKYAHITYFFNGGHETQRDNETRVLIPSVRHNMTYEDTPEMSAEKITKTVLKSLKTDPKDFYLINYANADMVGHSGNFEATCKAVKFLDTQLYELYKEIVEKQNGTLYITADHGNAESMWDFKLNQPRTAHTTNKVYFIAISKNKIEKLRIKELKEIAPFILTQMGLKVPKEMLS